MAGANRIDGNLHVEGTVTARTISVPTGSVGAAGLSATLKTGFLPLPLPDWRELVAAAITNAAGNGGLLASDSTPILERVNGATDPQLRLKWAAANVDALTFSIPSPPDLDNTASVTLNLRAKMGGATDTPTFTVDFREDVGGSNLGSTTGALSDTLATVTRAVTATASTSTQKAWTVTITPGTHGTDTVELYSAWISYTRA